MILKRLICFITLCMIFVLICGCTQEAIQLTDYQEKVAENIYQKISNNQTQNKEDTLYFAHTVFLLYEENVYYISVFYSPTKNYLNVDHQQVEESGQGYYESYKIRKNGKLKRTKNNHSPDKISGNVHGMAAWYADSIEKEEMEELFELVQKIN